MLYSIMTMQVPVHGLAKVAHDVKIATYWLHIGSVNLVLNSTPIYIMNVA